MFHRLGRGGDSGGGVGVFTRLSGMAGSSKQQSSWHKVTVE